MNLRPVVGATLCTLSLTMGAPPALANWNNTQWGMTVAEVLATVGASARQVRDERDKRIEDARRLVTSQYSNEELHFTVDYFFTPEERTLTKVNLVPEAINCASVRTVFAITRGAGQTEEKRIEIAPGQPAIVELTQTWQDPAGQGTVRYMAVSFETDLQYCQVLFEQ